MLTYFLQIFIFIWLFFLQNVYADIKIIDGDTIIFNEKKIRLFGIDAPETNQYCFDKNKIVRFDSYGVKIFDVHPYFLL